MPNREKIIKGLEIQLDDLQKYADANEILTLTQEQAKEIVALLKKQKPVEPSKDIARNRRCPKCFTILKGKFCHECGQAVKLK